MKLASDTAKRVLRRPVRALPPSTTPPAASVIVPTPAVEETACVRLAIEAVLANTTDFPYELVVVGPASGDKPTRDYLEVAAARNRHVRLIDAASNAGFAAACNAGVRASTGEYILLVDSDVVVTPEWLTGLAERLDDPTTGLIAPATNRCRYGIQVPPAYITYGEMLRFARRRRGGVVGHPSHELDVVDMFCAGLRRDVYEAVGPLDDRLEIGMLERDYARRVRDAGFKVVCAPDVFVHRFGGPSRAVASGDDGHSRAEIAGRVAAAVRRHVPTGSKVLVVSDGDESFVEFEGHEAWHFPQPEGGTDSRPRPTDDEAAIADLERLRERGARYLVLPATSLWWLDHYQGFRRHLERYRRPSDDPETAVIYELAETADGRAGGGKTA